MIDMGPGLEKATAVFARLREENPTAFDDMVEWLLWRRHNFSLTLTFHGTKFKKVEYSTTSGGNDSGKT